MVFCLAEPEDVSGRTACSGDSAAITCSSLDETLQQPKSPPYRPAATSHKYLTNAEQQTKIAAKVLEKTADKGLMYLDLSAAPLRNRRLRPVV